MIDSYPFFLMKEDSLFRFEIVEGHSHEIITISSRPDDDLKWIEAKKKLEILQACNKPTLIQIDLGLEEGFLADSEQALQGYILAIEEFNKSLLSPYKDIIQGLIIYRGSVFLEKNGTLSNESILDYRALIGIVLLAGLIYVALRASRKKETKLLFQTVL